VVSIICLTYNHERYVQSALHGFLSQDLSEPFEVLIHDDASTDRTAAIIRQWQARYPTIIKPVLQQENQYSRGGRPFETLLGRARGEFVASCEGDDFWVHPRKLQRQVDMLRRHPDLSSCAHNYYHFQESSLKIKPWSTIGSDFFLTPRQLMQIATLLWMPTLMFRRRFSAFPPERRFASLGDAFLTSYLGTFGPAAYLETLYGAVRRENEFSLWSPLPQARKQEWCIRTWTALQLMHERLGNTQAVDDLREKIERFPMAAATKRSVADDVLRAAGRLPAEACHG
jgi:glycosyltransferase involved in cell wall biosynthesis